MKKLFTLMAAVLLTFIGSMNASAKWIEDYSIDYSELQGFPFYVMGYVPEWNNGVMTDFGADYRYATQAALDGTGDDKWKAGESSVGTTTTQGGTVYQKVTGAGLYWHQYFIADGIPTEVGGSYIVKAMVKSSQEVTINVNMGWGWGGGQQQGCQVKIPASNDFQEVQWSYVEVGGSSCNLVAQPGTSTAKIEWKSVKVGHDGTPMVWVDLLKNGDAEKPWGNLANTDAGDKENNYKVCAWAKEKGVGTHPATIESEAGKPSNHVFVVHATEADTPGDASAWDNQFWIEAPQAFKTGDKVKVHFLYKASQNAKANTQVHGQNPGSYIVWHAIGDINFTTQWQEFDGVMSIGGDMDGTWSIAFNLNAEVKSPTDFYFDDMRWEALQPASETDYEEVSYSILMKDDHNPESTSDGTTKITTIDDIIEEGSQFVASIDEATEVYTARGGHGVKLGTKSKIGTLNLKLAQPVQPTKIVAKVRKYNDKGENYICFNGQDFELSDNTSEDITIEYDGNTTVSELVFNTTAEGKKYRTYVIGVTVYYMIETGGDTGDDGTFKKYTTLDFNACAGGAVSRAGRHAGDITAANGFDETNAFVVSDENGNTLSLIPNNKPGDYPESAEPCTKFVQTNAGPQLRVSGGYSGAKMTINKGADNLKLIRIVQTNWSRHTTADKGNFDPSTGVWTSANAAGDADVTFTVQADTTWICHSTYDADGVYTGWERDEVLVNDLGQVWINRIEVNPVQDLVVAPAAGSDISAALSDELSGMKSLPKTITIKLAAGSSYTSGSSIILDGSVEFTIDGGGATVDASSLKTPFIQMSTTSGVDANSAGFYPAKNITIKDVAITGITNQFFYANKQKYLIETLSVDNSIILLEAGNVNVFDTQSGGVIGTLSITNSTVACPGKNTGTLYSSQSGQKATEAGLEVQTLSFKNSTFYNIANGKNLCTHRQNSQKWLKYEVLNCIGVDCGKKNQFAQGMNGGGSSNNPTFIIKGNTFNHGGADTSLTDYKAEDGIAAIVSFADAANGDFTQSNTTAGDPRWISKGSTIGEATAIEAVKTVAEDGAWYTIQGQRVAQPTKGLYIHNGRKVVIK